MEMVLAPANGASTPVAIPGRLDRVPIETVVVAKSTVLARDYGTDQVRGDLVERGPAFLDSVTFHAAEQISGVPGGGR